MSRVEGNVKRAPRIDLRRPAVLIDSEGGEYDVTILDVSGGGFRLEVPESPRIGEFVTLRVERHVEFPAQIRWALGEFAGGTFLAAVDPEDWQAGSSMAEDTAADDRRDGGDRRGEDRREGGDRRMTPREGERRKEERRGGDRRR
jgi:hypothetical protein